MSDARSVLSRLRHGLALSEADLTWVSQALADGALSDAQTGAFAMGICLRGLSEAERVALTRGMRDSGKLLSWDLPGPVLDKHSTGGIGDCVSLVLAPALAACGAYVPMISGRGLGHTGGTLDKLDAIPGLVSELEERRLQAVVADAGCAITGASADIAPADKRLYAVRDVTATVDSLDLITASILSKKLAAGLDGLVLDVKTGSGAFMKDMEAARALARSLVSTANAAGCKTSALITDMSQPLVPAIGNALEVEEVMQVLTGQQSGPIAELTAVLGGVLLADAGLESDVEAGAAAIAQALRDGRAAERFGRMIAAQGGPVRFLEDWSRFLPEATVIREVPAPETGVLAAIDGEALGQVVVALGGGRRVEGDQIDPSVGLSGVLRLGAQVTKDQPLAMVHAARPEAADAAARSVAAVMRIEAEAKSTVPDLILERIG